MHGGNPHARITPWMAGYPMDAGPAHTPWHPRHPMASPPGGPAGIVKQSCYRPLFSGSQIRQTAGRGDGLGEPVRRRAGRWEPRPREMLAACGNGNGKIYRTPPAPLPDSMGFRTSENSVYAKLGPVTVTRNPDITATATGLRMNIHGQKRPDVSVGGSSARKR